MSFARLQLAQERKQAGSYRFNAQILQHQVQIWQERWHDASLCEHLTALSSRSRNCVEDIDFQASEVAQFEHTQHANTNRDGIYADRNGN